MGDPAFQPHADEIDVVEDLILKRPRTMADLIAAVVERSGTVDRVTQAKIGSIVQNAVRHLIRAKRVRAWGGSSSAPVYMGPQAHAEGIRAINKANKPQANKDRKQRRALKEAYRARRQKGQAARERDRAAVMTPEVIRR